MIKGTFTALVRLFYIALDIIGISAAILLAGHIRQAAIPQAIRDILLDWSHPFHFVFTAWLVAVLFFNGIYRLYETRRELLEAHELVLLARSFLFSAMTLIGLVYAFKIEGFPRSVFLLTLLFSFAFLSAWRIAKRLFVNYLVARGYNNFNVLIIGAGRVGLTLAEEIRRRPRLGLKICGFLDDFKTTHDLAGYPVLGRLIDLAEVSRKNFITKIFVTIHPDGTVFHDILETAKEQRLAVRVVPQAFDKATGDLLRYNIGFIPVLEYCDLGQTRKQYGKRLFDIVVSLLALLVLSPFWLVIMLFIYLDSPGPVFYFSRRVGFNGREFFMWKFRSMVADADARLKELQQHNEVDGPIFKMRCDPRITRLGRFLRKYSIDELPQLVNVLLGDMSMVGPRPLPVAQVDKNDPRQLKRLEVRPGITGLWQVRGRSDLTFSRLVGWDTWYINNWSFSLDMSILLRTPTAVLAGRGAY